MKLKHAMTLGVVAMVLAAACGRPQPPEVAPGPDPDSIAREQARRDSIAREQARRDSIERARMMEEERVGREREVEAARIAAITREVTEMLGRRVHFDYDKSAIRAGDDTEVLMQKLAVLQANPGLRIEIVGHCDERGSDEYNLNLGNRRAIAARDFLVNRGIAADRVTVMSRGEEDPVDAQSNEEAWAANRRDEFRITAGGDRLARPGM